MFIRAALVLCVLVPLATCWTGKIVFQDEFDGNSLDTSKWEYETGCSGYGSGNLECYVGGTNNVQVRGGNLVITAKVESRDGKDYTSGRIRQKGPGFAYGAYVARMKLPKGKHLWPAFWMLKATGCKFEEIDIMEYRGQEVSNVELSAHYGRSWDALVSKGYLRTVNGVDLSADFHEYAVLWLEKKLEWYVDNVKLSELTLEPNEWRNGQNTPCGDNIQPFAELNNFVFNMAVGGAFFDNHGDLTVPEARQWPKNTFEIDYVRIYQD
ncbi:unnamed protein product [Allacma fusca]|uniref:GH16 domain-containing protein n=1 Tax=Allacma fusca TaxID=39272 RepID=A0A8J2Q1S5_9HEXA|nr:unnamed protein product [Allacma fusca]